MAALPIQECASHAHFCHVKQMPQVGREGVTAEYRHPQKWEANVRDITHLTQAGEQALHLAPVGDGPWNAVGLAIG